MRHVFSILILVLTTTSLTAQRPNYRKLMETFKITDQTDEFTKENMVSTSYMLLDVPKKNKPAENPVTFVKFYYLQGIIIMELRTQTYSVLSVNEREHFYIKLKDEEVLDLRNIKFAVSGAHDGAIPGYPTGSKGIALNYAFTKEQFTKLTVSQVDKCKLITNSGYIEINPSSDDLRVELQKRLGEFLKYLQDNKEY